MNASPGTARRPDPLPWVPTPAAEGSSAPTGEVTALSPSGPHAGARAAFLEFWGRMLGQDEQELVDWFVPSVGLLNRPQTMERSELIRRIRTELDRSHGRGARVGELLDVRAIRVREVEAEGARGSSILPGDLVVTAPRLRTAAPPFGVWEEASTVSLVFRREGGRYVIVAAEL